MSKASADTMREKLTNTLAVVEASDMIAAPSADELESNVRRYQDMQKTLDRLMPDQIVETGTNADGTPKLFRRKGYWKAIAQGFNLNVELVREERQEHADDFGYCVTYKASDPRTGRSADGDGACFASEKAQRRGGIGGTEHNVRAHAHTRATNRAVSTLVAFGEVSAEELETTDRSEPKQRVVTNTKPATPRPAPTLEDHDGPEKITEVRATATWKNGTTVHKIVSTRRVYTCLDDGHASVAETAIDRDCEVEIDYAEQMTKARDGKEPRAYNALKSIALIERPVETTLGSPVGDDPPPVSIAPDVDDIPF
jgi:hypothetical protein